MKRFLTVTILLLVCTISYSSIEAEAQSRVGPHIGVNIDNDELFIGGNGWFTFASFSDRPLIFNPHIDIFFIDNVTVIDFNFNAVVLFSRENAIQPFAGPGLLFGYRSVGDNDFGLNITGGVNFDIGSFNPFVQGVLSISDQTALKLMGGIAFDL